MVRVVAITVVVFAAADCEKINPDFDGPGGDSSTAGSTESSTGSTNTTTAPSTATGTATSSTQGVSASGGTDGTSTSTTSSPSSSGGPSTGVSGSTGTPPVECSTAEILADGPILYLRLGEANGNTATDASGNGQDADYNGVTLGVPGASWDGDTAVQFAGNVNSYVILSDVSPIVTDAFTVEFWLQAGGAGVDESFFSYTWPGQNDGILIDEPSAIDVQLFGVSASSGIDVTDGQWHHLAVTWRSTDGRTRLYLDGTLAFFTTGHGTGQQMQQGAALVLGQDQDSVGGGFDGNQAFGGVLDELVVYDAELDATRIAAHMQSLACPDGP